MEQRREREETHELTMLPNVPVAPTIINATLIPTPSSLISLFNPSTPSRYCASSTPLLPGTNDTTGCAQKPGPRG